MKGGEGVWFWRDKFELVVGRDNLRPAADAKSLCQPSRNTLRKVVVL